MGNEKKERILISNYVKSLRSNKGMTAEEMAVAYGVSRQAITRYEMGVYDEPSVKIASKFCKTFEVDLLEFSDKFHYKNKNITTAFELESQIKKRFKLEFSEKSERECIKNFYKQYNKKYNLTHIVFNDTQKDYGDENINVLVPYNCECKNKNNETIRLYRFMSATTLIKEPRNYSYRSMDHAISNVAAYTKEEIGCNNYIFITNNRKMYNFFFERNYKKNDSNVMLVYTRDQITFDEPELLFGKRFI